MKKSLLIRFFVFIFLAGVFGTRFFYSSQVNAAPWQQNVDPWVLQTAAEQGETEFLVFLSEQADLSAADTLATKLEKGTYVYATLTTLAERTQKPVIEQLDALGAVYRPFWVANMIWVRGNQTVVEAMAQRADVAHVYANPWLYFGDLPEESPSTVLSPEAIEWSLTQVNADDVWAAGVTGQGAVIGGQDTGYDWEHPALQNQYRGWDGGSADHDYNWHDAIHEDNPHTAVGNPCGFDSPFPCDDNSHGTHTMGTMVGDDGGTNQIGMAPGAKWIGCRNMEQGWGMPSTYAECYEWFIAPYPAGGNPAQDGDPSKAPDVISNSWACPPEEGCNADTLLPVVQAVRAAGILTVHSAGNSGSSCSTVNTPSATYTESFSVGATDSVDAIANFSSRGPSTFTGEIKPNISAPGVAIRSSILGGAYGFKSGTSMAAPHVAGLVGLLVSANPALSGQVDLLEDIIEETAVNLTSTQACGGIPGTEIPNNVFGWGRIDAYSAYQRALFGQLEIASVAAPDPVQPGDWLTYTITVSHTLAISPTNHVELSQTIPVSTTFITATLPHTFDGTTITWTASALGLDEDWNVDLTVQVEEQAEGEITSVPPAAQSDEISQVEGQALSVTVLPSPVLGVQKSTSIPLVYPGDLLTYTLTVSQTQGALVMHNLVLTDVIPVNTSFVTATLPYTFDGSTITWTKDSLGPGEVFSTTLIVQVDAEASGVISNDQYSASSNEAAQVNGIPIKTPVITYYLYFPWIVRE